VSLAVESATAIRIVEAGGSVEAVACMSSKLMLAPLTPFHQRDKTPLCAKMGPLCFSQPCLTMGRGVDVPALPRLDT
jgi:hypothetical protein